MAPRALVVILALLCTSVDGRSDADVAANPIRKIVTLLQDMSKEVEAEGAKETDLFNKFQCYCNGGTADLKKEAADAAAEIQTLSAQFEQQTAEKAGLDGDLVRHKADREGATQDLAKATALRNKENAEYAEDLADQQTSFDALSKAVPALENGSGGASLLQADGGKAIQRAVQASQAASSAEKQMVVAFLEGKQEESAPGTDQIVGILKNMGDEMEKSIKDIQTTEDAALRGYNDLKSAKEQEVEVASEAIEAKTIRVGNLAVSIVQSQDGVDDATEAQASASKFLSTLDAQCAEKQKAQAERTQTRAEEVTAISQAVSILNDDDSLDVFKKAVPGALLQQAASSHPARKFQFLQGHSALPADRLRKADGIIEAVAQGYRGRKLSLLSHTMKRAVAKGAVDFGAITKTIDTMIGTLGSEQKDDEKHKTWCQAEFGSSADETERTQSKAEHIDAGMAEVNDEVSSLADDIAALRAGVASLDKDVAQATEARSQEHVEYLDALQLTEAAIQLMGKAKNRLNKFYSPALYVGPAKQELSDEDAIVQRLGASLVQVSKHSISRVVLPEAPNTEFLQSKTKDQPSGGVIALMDMLTRDLEASLAEAKHNEKAAQTDYTELAADSQATRSADTKSLLTKVAAKADLESRAVDLKENRQLTNQDLLNIHAYTSELHASCDFVLENFSLRTDARTSEIEGLKNAKSVLAGASYN